MQSLLTSSKAVNKNMQESTSNPGCHSDAVVRNENDCHGSSRRLPRLSWRLLARGAAVICALMLLGLPVSIWLRGKRQEARVAALLKFDGTIEAQYGEYSYRPPPMAPAFGDDGTKLFTIVLGRGQRAAGYSVVDDPPGFLEWLVPVFGENCFVHVTQIYIDEPLFSDADVDLLLAFPDVRVIVLSHTQITDRGLIKLACLNRLVRLDVHGTKVSGESLRHFVACRELKEFDIRDTKVDERVFTLLKEALPDCWIRWHGRTKSGGG